MAIDNAILGNSYIIPNITYSLDYTKSNINAPQNVTGNINLGNTPMRILVFALQFPSSAVSNWTLTPTLSTFAYQFPNGGNPFQNPPTGGTLQLNGVVPDDYTDVPANTVFSILAYMSGSAVANSNFQLTLVAKPILNKII